jgi:hypothetical protein
MKWNKSNTVRKERARLVYMLIHFIIGYKLGFRIMIYLMTRADTI